MRRPDSSDELRDLVGSGCVVGGRVEGRVVIVVEQRPTLGLAGVVDHGATGDLEQPRPEASRVAERVEVLPGEREHLLDDVVAVSSLCPAADLGPHDRGDQTFVAFHEGAEGTFVAGRPRAR